MITGPLYALS